MIVREIKDRPLELISTFDWFNDFNDTIAWAKHTCPAEVVALYEAAFAVWLPRFNARPIDTSQHLTVQNFEP